MQNQQRARGQNSELSAPSTGLTRTPSAQAPDAVAPASAPAPYEKGMTLEQSVWKFRVVEALRNGDTTFIFKAIRETVENGPRASTSYLTTTGSNGAFEDTTILHLALQCAEVTVVEFVLSNAQGTIDINARDKDGNTPLHVAAINGRVLAVKLLLEQRDINVAMANSQGQLPLDLAQNSETFQLLQLSQSLFMEARIKHIQELIASGDYNTLAQTLDKAHLETVLDINSPEYASEPITIQTGGTLLHEAVRKKNSKLIEVLLLHGADPFFRDRNGKLPESITNDNSLKTLLRKSPAAVTAQRSIQEKAVLGYAEAQGAVNSAGGDSLAGRESREMKGYLKKWINYRGGYQLRWFVLKDGILSYYKHQDDLDSACRGAINMRIAKLHISADEKTKFEIIGKSSVQYTLKATHEVEAKRWFWSLNNSIQWTKDQAKEEERQAALSAELLKNARGRQSGSLSLRDSYGESTGLSGFRRIVSHQNQRTKSSGQKPECSGTIIAENQEGDEFAEAVTASDAFGAIGNDGGMVVVAEDEDDDNLSVHERAYATKDALNITAQCAKLQLEIMASIYSVLLAELTQSSSTSSSGPKVTQALSTYDAAIRSLSSLVGNLLHISNNRDSYWQHRLERELNIRSMWEASMTQMAKEQEILEARVGHAELRYKQTKRALRESMTIGISAIKTSTGERAYNADEVFSKSPTRDLDPGGTTLGAFADLSQSESDDDEEFFDAIDAGQVEVGELPPSHVQGEKTVEMTGIGISSSFQGYENGIRQRLKIDADNRPKVSLWSILKSMIGKDMTKMTLPVTFNEPTSLLFRCCEDMEYADLLGLAAKCSDSMERLAYVAIFAASGYASTIDRVAKPFNPLLGETFEYVRPDKGYRFFSEQVSHHPPVGAAWAESPNWTYWGESAITSKFYGRSFDFNPLGTWFLKLRSKSGGQEDLYTWKKVTSSVIGIITGSPAIDNYGLMEIKNWITGEVAHVNFKPRGWQASSAYQVSGKIMDDQGKVRYSIGGRWNSKLYVRLAPEHEAQIVIPNKDGGAVQQGSIADPNQAYLIWQANRRPKGVPFNLTPFVLTFNHIDDKLRPWLPPTDSRLRPDQRAMEDAKYDIAVMEKSRLEENQRARRRQREERGEQFVPAWFTRARCDVSGEKYWKFDGKYWEQRENAGPHGDGTAWEGLEPIYGDAE